MFFFNNKKIEVGKILLECPFFALFFFKAQLIFFFFGGLLFLRPLFVNFFFLSILHNKPNGQRRGFVCLMLFGATGYFQPPPYHLLLAEGHASQCPTYNLLQPTRVSGIPLIFPPQSTSSQQVCTTLNAWYFSLLPLPCPTLPTPNHLNCIHTFDVKPPLNATANT